MGPGIEMGKWGNGEMGKWGWGAESEMGRLVVGETKGRGS